MVLASDKPPKDKENANVHVCAVKKEKQIQGNTQINKLIHIA